MRKLLFLMVLLSVWIVGIAANRTGFVNTGQTVLSTPMTFSASDTIITSGTYTITIQCDQAYPQKQNMYATLTTISGSPSVAIKLWGKCFTGDAWVQIGSTQTWTSTGNNPVNISAVTPNQYRTYKAEFVCSGATQKVKVTAFEFKTWYTSGLYSSGTLTDGTATINGGAIVGATTIAASDRITGTGGATITGAASNINASSNFATNINTGTTNAALSLGGGSGTVAVNSSDWDITTTGVMTGIGAITTDGLVTASLGANVSGAAVNLNASSNFATNIGTGTTDAAVSIGGGSNTVAINSTALDISTTGAVTGATTITASGVITGGFKLLAPVLNTDGSETLTAAQSGKMIIASKSNGATTVTLPDPGATTVGVIYYILQTANQNLIVDLTTADGNSIVCDGVATSDAVTISTSSHLIGAGMVIIGISDTQWYVGALNPEAVLTPETAD